MTIFSDSPVTVSLLSIDSSQDSPLPYWHFLPLSCLSTAHQFFSPSFPFPQHCRIGTIRVCRKCSDRLPTNYGTKRSTTRQVKPSGVQVNISLVNPRLIVCNYGPVCVRVHVYVRVYLRVWVSVRTFVRVCLSVCHSVCLSVGRSVGLAVNLSISLSVWLSVCHSVCLYIWLSVGRSVGRSVCLLVSQEDCGRDWCSVMWRLVLLILVQSSAVPLNDLPLPSLIKLFPVICTTFLLSPSSFPTLISLSPPRKGLLSRKQLTNGPEFGVTLGKIEALDGFHVVFGIVLSGMEVLDAIAQVPTYSYKTKTGTVDYATFIAAYMGFVRLSIIVQLCTATYIMAMCSTMQWHIVQWCIALHCSHIELDVRDARSTDTRCPRLRACSFANSWPPTLAHIWLCIELAITSSTNVFLYLLPSFDLLAKRPLITVNSSSLLCCSALCDCQAMEARPREERAL